MPNFAAIITDFATGDDLDIIRTITNVPSGQLISTASLVVRELEASTTAILTKTITTTLTPDGVITANQLLFVLSGGNTLLLNPGNYVYHHIVLRTNAGKEYTPEKGRIFAFL